MTEPRIPAPDTGSGTQPAPSYPRSSYDAASRPTVGGAAAAQAQAERDATQEMRAATTIPAPAAPATPAAPAHSAPGAERGEASGGT